MKWVACMYTIPYFSEILQLEEIKDLLIVPGLCHFHGMMEYWNNVLKTYNSRTRIFENIL
jgi:uncharacterized protein Usg